MSIYSEIIYNKVWRIVIVIKQIGLDWFQVLQLNYSGTFFSSS